MKRVICLILPAILHTARLFAGVDSLGMAHFNLDNGFPTNNVYSLLQDRHGYIWFATDNGVVKYNGYTFRIFNASDGLPSNDVWDLYEDSRGRIWLSSFTNKIGYLEDDKYKDIGLDVSSKSSAPEINDNGKFLSFGLDINGVPNFVVIYNGKILVIPTTVFDGPSNKSAYSMSGNMLYKIDSNCNVYSYNYLAKNAKPIKVFANRELVGFRASLTANREIYATRFNSDNIKYIDIRRKETKSVNIKDYGAGTDETIYLAALYYKTGKGRKTTLITHNKFYHFDSKLNYINTELVSELIPSRSQVSFYFTDYLGNKWMPTVSDGVWKVPVKKDIFKLSPSLKKIQNAEYLGQVDSSTFWWSRNEEGLFEVRDTQVVGTMNFRKGDKVQKVVGKGDKLFLLVNSRIYTYSKRTRKLESLINENSRLFTIDITNNTEEDVETKNNRFNNCNDIAFFMDKLYAPSRHLVKTLEKYNDTVWISKVSDERYKSMYVDTTFSRIWFYNVQKILILDPKTLHKIVIDVRQLPFPGISVIKNIEVDKWGNVYLQIGNAIFVYYPALGSVKKVNLNFNIENGVFHLYHDKIIFADKFGLAYSTINSTGIKQIKALANEGAGYYNMVNDFVVDAFGNVILSTDKGIYNAKYHQLAKSTTFSFRDSTFFRLTIRAPFTENVSNNDTFYFDQIDQKLDIGVINFYGKGSPQYQYTISDGKHITKGTGEVFIGNLSSGVYYKISYSIKDELWQSRPFNFYIYRNPYWYETSTWRSVFWVSGIILFLGLVVFVILATRFVVARKNNKKRAQTELELRAIHSQINPHFIFNTLSTALYFINKKRFDDAYVHVSKFSRLLRSYLKASHDRYTILGDEIQMLRNYIELQQTRFEQKFIYRIEIDNKIPVNNIQIPSLLLQPLIENAINHGLFHLEGNGELILKFQQGADNTELICVIEDNGVGRAKAKEINDTSSTKDSYGTKLTNQLLEVFREYEHMDIEMNYIDKEPPLSGTIITLTIKRVRYIA